MLMKSHPILLLFPCTVSGQKKPSPALLLVYLLIYETKPFSSPVFFSLIPFFSQKQFLLIFMHICAAVRLSISWKNIEYSNFVYLLVYFPGVHLQYQSCNLGGQTIFKLIWQIQKEDNHIWNHISIAISIYLSIYLSMEYVLHILINTTAIE